MTDKKKNNPRDNKDNSSLNVCPQCAGAGKVSGKRDDTDICGFDSKKVICSLCHGSGTLKNHRHLPHNLRSRRPKSIFLKKPRPGRGGRPSLGKNISLQPSMPTAGYPEGNMVPESQRQIDTVQQQPQFDIDNGSDDLISQEDPPQEPLQDQTADSTETATIGESFLPDMQINSKQLTESSLPTDDQINPMIPSALNPLNALDVIGTPDPADFQINTDVQGNTGF